jgi:hypothetical protein
VQWNIGFVKEPIQVFLNSDARHDIQWFPKASDSKFLADPFGLLKQSKIFVMCEEYDYETLRGRIVSVELTSEGFVSQPQIALDLPYHASYPYLFEDAGTIYCVPETAQAEEITLFESTHFPNGWKKVATPVKGFAGRDNTIFKHGGLWWLSSAAGGGRDLFLWYSEELPGRWRPHSANPVKSDISSSRPAGTPFVYKGTLYRPAQDCSATYGKRITLNRVRTLTPAGFQEEACAHIEPDSNSPYPDGMHTISGVGSFTLLDGMRATFAKKLSRVLLGHEEH